jgi:cold shock CspA family protein
MNRRQGRLKNWKGTFGFILYEGNEIFVHLSNYLHGFTPEVNQIVEFELGPANKPGKANEAYRVIVVKSADQVFKEFNLRGAGLDTLVKGVPQAEKEHGGEV